MTMMCMDMNAGAMRAEADVGRALELWREHHSLDVRDAIFAAQALTAVTSLGAA